LTQFSKDIILDEELNNGFGFWIRASNLIASAESEFQKIELFSTPKFGKVLRIDNYFMTSEKDEFFYHENMVHPAMLSHPNPKKKFSLSVEVMEEQQKSTSDTQVLKR